MSTDTDMEAANPRRCAACKYLRRRCSQDCVLAPYFPALDPQRYACVQRVFGAGNIARTLQQLPVQERGQAADAMATEAYRRVRDPVYGCAGVINRLQEEIRAVQCELARTQAQIAMHGAAYARPPMDAAQSARIPLRQQDDAQMQQAPFVGLDELLSDLICE